MKNECIGRFIIFNLFTFIISTFIRKCDPYCYCTKCFKKEEDILAPMKNFYATAAASVQPTADPVRPAATAADLVNHIDWDNSYYCVHCEQSCTKVWLTKHENKYKGNCSMCLTEPNSIFAEKPSATQPEVAPAQPKVDTTQPEVDTAQPNATAATKPNDPPAEYVKKCIGHLEKFICAILELGQSVDNTPEESKCVCIRFCKRLDEILLYMKTFINPDHLELSYSCLEKSLQFFKSNLEYSNICDFCDLSFFILLLTKYMLDPEYVNLQVHVIFNLVMGTTCFSTKIVEDPIVENCRKLNNLLFAGLDDPHNMQLKEKIEDSLQKGRSIIACTHMLKVI